MNHAKEYLGKHQLTPSQIDTAPAGGLRLAVVIPCRDEADLPLTLSTLRGCGDPGVAVEVLVVLNASETDPDDVRLRNRESRRIIDAMEPGSRLRFHALEFERLPKKHAGVGLARKLGMDEAVARFVRAGQGDGIIACLDADCRVSPDYLLCIVDHFDAHPATPACSIHFEHPLEGHLSADHYRAIAEYELYLRYYRHGLAFAGHPCAHYTVGSCMAVRAGSYVRQGGMNRRQGAEDFYFLNKLMLLGGFSELRNTTVRPSPRASRRAPFGTGRAVGDALDRAGAPLRVYAPQVFDELRALINNVAALRDDPDAAAALPDTLRAYLESQDLAAKLGEIRAHTATPAAFSKRFLRWFDGFRALKFIRFASERVYPRVPVQQAALELLRRMERACEAETAAGGTVALLRHYRRMDREGVLVSPPAGALHSTG